MNHFCTLFDSYYLNRGLLLYQSLEKHCPDFHLYIFTFDNLSFDILKELNLKNATLITLKEFESEDLLRVKPTRSKGEYCWTCTSFTIAYAIKRFNLTQCTYLDADLFFYDSPTVLLDELKSNSILITEHRYTPVYDQSATSGIYCVQFMTFKNNDEGMTALNWWAERCLEWCYGRFEDGKFGDQKYLDDWLTRFKGVHVLKHPGGGVAPWNIQQYHLISKKNQWWIKDKITSEETKLVFYHFHHLKFFSDFTVNLSYIYKLRFKNTFRFYAEYLTGIVRANNMLKKEFGFDAPVESPRQTSALYKLLRNVVIEYRKLFGNVIDLRKLHP